MNRRGFLAGFAAAAGALLVPEEPRVRVYSFAASWMAEQAEFERALATGRIDGGTWRISQPAFFPPGGSIRNAKLILDRDARLVAAYPNCSLIGTHFYLAPGLRQPDADEAARASEIGQRILAYGVTRGRLLDGAES